MSEQRICRPCLACGRLTTMPRCPVCYEAHAAAHNRPARRARGWDRESERRRERGLQSSTARGYDQAWRRLSERARELQPWCSDCGTPGTLDNPLTTDHSPEAWERKQAGLPIRLCDVDVCCRHCNSERGMQRINAMSDR